MRVVPALAREAPDQATRGRVTLETRRTVCSEPGCPSWSTTRGRCGAHQVREYDGDHRRARALIGSSLPVPCGYCGDQVTVDDYVAAHVVDRDPTAGWMAAHAICNERAKREGDRGSRKLPPAPGADTHAPSSRDVRVLDTGSDDDERPVMVVI